MTAFVLGLPEHKVRVIAPDVGGGFGSKIFLYAEESALRAGRRSRSAGRSSGPPSAARASCPTRTAATTSPTPSWRWTRTASSSRCASTRPPTWAPTCRPSRPACRPSSTRRCSPASTRRRRSTARSRRSSPTPPRSTPIAAPGGPRRPTWSSGSSSSAAREIEHRSGRAPADELHRQGRLPLPDAGRADLRHRRLRGDRSTRRWSSPTTPASRPAQGRVRGQRASCAASASRATSRPAASRRRPWSGALGARRRACGRAAKIRVAPDRHVTVFTGSHSHGQGHETTFAQLVVGQARRADRQRRDRPRRHRRRSPFGMGTYGSRSLAVGGSAIVKAVDKIIAKGKKIAAHLLEAVGGRHRVRGRQLQGRPAPTRRRRSARSRSPPTCRTTTRWRARARPGRERRSTIPTNFTYPAGAHICEVEIDPETGVVEVAEFTAVDDFGNVDQPDDRRGPGPRRPRPGHRPGADSRAAVYDKDSGQLLTGSYMDYCMPRADDRAELQGRLTRDAVHRTTRSASRAAARPAPSARRRPYERRAPMRSASRASSTCRRRREKVWQAIQAPADAAAAE